jgi:hypothetical protein
MLSVLFYSKMLTETFAISELNYKIYIQILLNQANDSKIYMRKEVEQC